MMAQNCAVVTRPDRQRYFAVVQFWTGDKQRSKAAGRDQDQAGTMTEREKCLSPFIHLSTYPTSPEHEMAFVESFDGLQHHP